MDKPRTYEAEYKKEAVKFAKEVGAKMASESLKIPYGTLCYCLVVNTNRNDCCNRFRDPKRIPDTNRSEGPAE